MGTRSLYRTRLATKLTGRAKNPPRRRRPVDNSSPDPLPSYPKDRDSLELLAGFSGWVANAFCPTGPGGGVDPTCSPNKGKLGYTTTGKTLPLMTDLTLVQALGGSTGAKLMQDKAGNKWVVKGTESGKLTKDHLQNEIDADRAYRALGFKVPEGGLKEWKGNHYKLTEFVEGKEMGTGNALFHKEASKGFIADALLSNWDSVGMSGDNMLVAKDGGLYRIDNGGALKYRAQGTEKGAQFGPVVTELQTLLDPSKNPTGAKAFSSLLGKSLTDEPLLGQVQHVLSKKAEVLEAITDPVTRGILEKRFDYLQGQAGIQAKPVVTPTQAATSPAQAVVAPPQTQASSKLTHAQLEHMITGLKQYSQQGTAVKFKTLAQHEQDQLLSHLGMDGQAPSPPDLHAAIQDFEVLHKSANQPTPSAPSPPPPPHARLSSGSGLAGYMKKKFGQEGVKFTQLHLDKIAQLNPDGIKNGTVLFHKAKANGEEQFEVYKKVLPPGTQIKIVKASKAALQSGAIDLQAVASKKKAAAVSAGLVGAFGAAQSTQPAATPAVTQGQTAGLSAIQKLGFDKTKPIGPMGMGQILKESGLTQAHLNDPLQKTLVDQIKKGLEKEGYTFKSTVGHGTVLGHLPSGVSTPTSSVATPHTPKVTGAISHTDPSIQKGIPVKFGPTPSSFVVHDAKPGGGSTSIKPELKTHFKENWTKLTKDEQKDIKDYTGHAYKALNDKMLECPPDFDCVKGHLKTRMDNIMSGLAKPTPLPIPVTTNRGFGLSAEKAAALAQEMINTKENGGTVNMPCFSSSSIDKGFSGNIRMHYTLKSGMLIKEISNYKSSDTEDEILVSPKQSFKVHSVVEKPGGDKGVDYHIYLEEV